MTLAVALEPRGPFSLALSARLAGDATRSFRDGVFEALVPVDGGSELVRAWQRPDGTVEARAATDAGVEQLRFVLALEDDHSEFLRQFAGDPLLRHAVRELRGLRPVRATTVVHALLRALCGQLIESRRARSLERRILRATCAAGPCDYVVPPRERELGRLAPAELRQLGLHARRAATLVRICRSIDLERLRGIPSDAAAARILRERGLGEWSTGVVFLEGLGRYDRALVGDLGLVKLCAQLAGRRPESDATAELLEPYGDWRGLASVYLLTGFSRGLIPLSDGSRTRRVSRAAAA